MLLGEFRKLAVRHDFSVIDARGSVAKIFRALRTEVEDVVSGMGLEAAEAAGPGEARRADAVTLPGSEASSA
jgi:hypothetical protein